MQDNGRRIIEVPEFLNLVAYRLDLHKRRELMLVSKYFFTSVGPIVWKRIPRLDIVQRLVKGAEGKAYKYRDPQKVHPSFSQITITLPLNPDLSRYDIYAPWVQELEIFAGRNLEIQNVGPFLTLLGGSPPLPSLRRLTTHTGADIGSREMTNFLTMFISPSLSEIRTIIYKKGLLLEFYPESAYDCPEGYKPSDQCRGILRSFSNLRYFSSTTYILEPAIFAIMGSLPHLELLGIQGFHLEDPVFDERVSISETWFPVLKFLRLYDVHPQDIKVLWNHPPIVKGLISALIQTDPTTAPDPSDDPMDGNEWIEVFLTALPHLSPALKDLTFYVGDEDGTRFHISQNARNGLHNSGLKNFKLKLKNTFGVDEDSEDE